MEDKFECPKCGNESYDGTHHGYYEIRTCTACDYDEDYFFGAPEIKCNFFADCSNTESLALQYIGWTGAILNNSATTQDYTVLANLKEALDHFKKRWEEILNETK